MAVASKNWSLTLSQYGAHQGGYSSSITVDGSLNGADANDNSATPTSVAIVAIRRKLSWSKCLTQHIMLLVEYAQIEVAEVQYLQEQMAASKVRRCHAILHINLELGDCVEQALQHLLAPVELRYIFGAR